MFERQEIQGDKIVVYFKYADKGLMVAAKDGLSAPQEVADGELAHFEMADKAGHWWPAKAKIDGGTVIVTSEQVQSPVAVRYAYAVSPENCNLYSRDGLPASPFCSKPELLQYDPGLPRMRNCTGMAARPFMSAVNIRTAYGRSVTQAAEVVCP